MIDEMPFTPEQEHALIRWAWVNVIQELGGSVANASRPTDPAFESPAGCFVTLREIHTHALRGCIGRMDAELPLLDAIREMSQAVLQDPRFTDRRVQLEELPKIDLEISVLSPMEKASHPLDFDRLTHGIELRVGRRRGVFLPQVAQDTGWSKEQLLARLCTEKMGLPADAWNDGELWRFTCDVIGPAPFPER